MKNIWKRILMLCLAFTTLMAGTAMAFEDLGQDPRGKMVKELRDKGIVNGIDHKRFAPSQNISWAEGVQLVVQAFKFTKDEKAKSGNNFKNVPKGKWYYDAFLIAKQNGLPVPDNVNPHQKMTREEFAHLLMSAVLKTGDYAFIQIFIQIEDGDKINPEYMNSIQLMLISNIVSLDKDKKFHPKKNIKRIEAAEWIYKALEFVKKQSELQPEKPQPDDVTMNVEKINNEVNKIVLSRGEKPNPGYTLTITRIEFKENKEAVIYYLAEDPDPNQMYPQVITEPKAVTYLSSEYTPVLKSDADSGVSIRVKSQEAE